jgi:hypothetical protein
MSSPKQEEGKQQVAMSMKATAPVEETIPTYDEDSMDMSAEIGDDYSYTIDGKNPFIYTDIRKQENIVRDVHSLNELYRCLKKQYWSPNAHSSMAIDMVSLFLKGQVAIVDAS